jgi:hypothetical protein
LKSTCAWLFVVSLSGCIGSSGEKAGCNFDRDCNAGRTCVQGLCGGRAFSVGPLGSKVEISEVELARRCLAPDVDALPIFDAAELGRLLAGQWRRCPTHDPLVVPFIEMSITGSGPYEFAVTDNQTSTGVYGDFRVTGAHTFALGQEHYGVMLETQPGRLLLDDQYRFGIERRVQRFVRLTPEPTLEPAPDTSLLAKCMLPDGKPLGVPTPSAAGRLLAGRWRLCPVPPGEPDWGEELEFRDAGRASRLLPEGPHSNMRYEYSSSGLHLVRDDGAASDLTVAFYDMPARLRVLKHDLTASHVKYVKE